MKPLFLLPLFLGLLAASLTVHAAAPGAVEARLAQQLGLAPADVQPGPIPGLYRIILGPQVAYVSADGRYLIRGDILDTRNGHNLTRSERDAARLAYIHQLGTADMIVFAPPHPRQTITVLTDIDCEYCRQLEQDRPRLNAMGIAIQYMFFPRDGVGSASWNKAVAVWCAKDRKRAFETAMRGEAVPGNGSCNAAAVAAGFQFGALLGIDGTPAIITETGRLIDGYLPAPALAYALEHGDQPASAAP